MYSNLPGVLLLSLALTLILETIWALLLGVRRARELILVLLVNVLTNPPVVLLYSLFPSLWLKIVLEASAVLIEWLIYRHCAGFSHPLPFSLGANAFSYLMGALLNPLLVRLL